MFEDSLFESQNQIRTGKAKWTTFSFAIQCIIMGVLVLIPLIYTEALPKAALSTLLVAPPPPPPSPPPPPAAIVKAPPRVQEIINNQLRAPSRIPKQIEIVKDEAPAPSANGIIGGIEGSAGMNGVIGGLLPVAPAAPIVKEATPQKIKVSQGVLQGNAISQPKPVYPAIAKAARIQGTVVLQAKISKEGMIEDLHAVSGHPMLIPAAIDAVKQWKYRPYLLNGEPVEVDTSITVNFTLGG